MLRKDKTAIVRIFYDLIKADSVIDEKELIYFSSMKKKYAIETEDEIAAQSMTFEEAITIIANTKYDLKKELFSDCKSMTISDGFCDRTEALLLIALYFVWNDKNEDKAQVISIQKKLMDIDPSQVIYIESEFDKNINQELIERYRHIICEFSVTGFHLIYIPEVIEHYKNTSDELFQQLVHFISPERNLIGLENLIKHIRNLSSTEFTKDVLCNKLKLERLRDVSPSFLIKIGDTSVNNSLTANYLQIIIDRNVTDVVINFVDVFSSFLSNNQISLNDKEDSNGQFIYQGFYKQLLDIYLLKHNIQSRLIIDFVHTQISLPDINRNLMNLHRKEKALYVLILLETPHGGICFNYPSSKVKLTSYDLKIKEIKKKYCFLYELFGGDNHMVPNIELPEIRRPMISGIRRTWSALESELYHVSDYNINKDDYGFFKVNINYNLLFFRDFKNTTDTSLDKFIFK